MAQQTIHPFLQANEPEEEQVPGSSLSGSCFVVQYLVASCLLAGLPEGWSSPDALVTQKHVSRVCPWVDKPVTLLDFQQAKQLTCYVCSSTLMGCSASWLFLDLEYLQFGASGC